MGKVSLAILITSVVGLVTMITLAILGIIILWEL